MSVHFHSLTFWLNAFIPRSVVGATVTLLEGEYRGLTALRGPPCYLTDQRDFSNHGGARSRMHSRITVDFAGEQTKFTQIHKCDDLVECNPVSGEVLHKWHASTSRMKFTLAASEPVIVIRMDCRYFDPLSTPAHGLGEIEYNGMIAIDPVADSIALDVMICMFPAFEAYAVVNDGSVRILFRHSPPPGILTLGPPRGAQRRIRSQLENESFTRPNGS